MEEKRIKEMVGVIGRNVPANNLLLAWTVPANKFLLARTVPANKFLLAGTPKNLKFQKRSPPSKYPLVRPQKCKSFVQRLRGTLFPEGNQLSVN